MATKHQSVAETSETPASSQPKRIYGCDPIEPFTTSIVHFPKALIDDEGDLAIAVMAENYLAGVGICEGDKVFFHRQDTAKNGQIVLAQVGDSLCIRKYVANVDTQVSYLRSFNPSVSDVYAPNFKILGVAAWILRRFDNAGND